MNLLAIKLISGAVGLAAIAAAGYMIYTSIWDKGYAQAQVEYREKERIAIQEYANGLLSYANEITRLQGERDANKANSNALADKLRRVSIHIPACSESGTSENTAGENGTTGVFSEQVDRIFARFQQRIASLAERCDQLNEDVIMQNGAVSAIR